MEYSDYHLHMQNKLKDTSFLEYAKTCDKINASIKMYKHYSDVILEETKIDIIQRGRQRNKVELFKIFCNYSREKLKQTYQNIGFYLGRNHATIVHACKTYSDIYQTDKDFREKADFFYDRFETIRGIQIEHPYKKKLNRLVKEASETTRASWFNMIQQTLIIQESVNFSDNE